MVKLDIYLQDAELSRFQLLADRLQRQADKDPQVCMDVEDEEEAQDRELFEEKKPEEEERVIYITFLRFATDWISDWWQRHRVCFSVF